MYVYILVAILSTFMMRKYEKNKKKIFLFLSFLIVFLVMALRYGIGYDYLHIYVPTFNNIVNSNVTPGSDIGNYLLCKIIGTFTTDSFYYFLITSFIICFFTFKAILENSSKPSLSILLFVISGIYLDSFNLVRQYMALSIILYSIKFVKENNFKKYAICILIAATLHNSAIIMLPLFFVLRMKMTIFKKALIIFGLILLMPVANSIFNFLISLTKYNRYFSTSYGSIDPSYSEIIISVLLFIFASFFYKKAQDDNLFNIFFNYCLLFLIISILSFKIILAYRILVYFKVVSIFLIPKILSYIKFGKNRLLAYIIVVLFFCGITYIGGSVFGWYDMDYISIFDK